MKKLIVILPLLIFVSTHDTASGNGQFTWDEKGYILFCLCMGRFGNQAEHFLGGLAFAKSLNRTLVLPPWRTYKNIKFTEWFRLDTISKYHRVIVAEDFMQYLAPEYWPSENRTGYCFSFDADKPCEMKVGNPFGPFWNELGVEFNRTETYQISSSNIDGWRSRFPPSKYPVLALKGAPAPFPMAVENHHLQKYLQWSDNIIEQGQHYIQSNFPGQKFIGIHLRNGVDWERACEHATGMKQYMATPQCLDSDSDKTVTTEMCFPSAEKVLRLTRKIVQETDARVIYVATDKNPLVQELEQELKDFQVKVFHQDPWLPQIDLYILGQSDYFIGNCVSSFTSFVTRERMVNNKPTAFWGFS